MWHILRPPDQKCGSDQRSSAGLDFLFEFASHALKFWTEKSKNVIKFDGEEPENTLSMLVC